MISITVNCIGGHRAILKRSHPCIAHIIEKNGEILDIRNINITPEKIMATLSTCPLSFKGTAQHILETRRITRDDQQLLMRFGMATIDNQETLSLLNQISEGLRFGRLRVVD